MNGGFEMDNLELRKIENESIRQFLKVAGDAGYIQGRVLDFGSGQGQYGSLVVEYGADWWAYDRRDYPANVSGADVGDFELRRIPEWDTIVCTQVLQYIPDPDELILDFRNMLREGGHLILTYPTTWPLVEPEDLWRFTKPGVEGMLARNLFETVMHHERARIDFTDFYLPIGYGVVGRPCHDLQL